MDRLEEGWGEQVQVVRFNVHGDGAMPLLEQLGFRFTPTFILLDGNGREVWRTVGVIRPDEVRQQVNTLE